MGERHMKIKRPMPPDGMPAFAPAKEVWDWLKLTILNPDHKIFNPDHKHLLPQHWGDIAIVWAECGYKRGGKDVIGTTEKVMFNAGGWKKERQEAQMVEWFGFVPDFLITLSASFCRDHSDVEFCALIEHELYHIAHAKNEFGMPKYSRDTGKPILAIQAHDVEEFVGVVRRYGASQDDIQRLIDAAMKRPEVSRVALRHACGTCSSLRIA